MNRTFNVLVIEDDVALGEVTCEGLRLLNHHVTWVSTASAALEALRVSHSFAVILLDLRLGDEGGEGIFEKLQLFKITYPPVIVLSAEPASVIRLAAKRIKTPHVLQKPATIGQINSALHHAMASA